MLRRMALALTVILGAGLTLEGRALSDEKGELDVGLFAGYHIFSESTKLGASANDGPGSGPIWGLRAGYGLISRLGLELELGAILPSEAHGSTDGFSGFAYRLQLLLRFTPDNLGGGVYLVAGGGGTTVTESSKKTVLSDTKFSPHAGFAAKVDVGERWGIRFDGRAFLDQSKDSSTAIDWEGTVSLYYVWGRKPKVAPVADQDHDGVADADDACPTVAGVATSDPKTNGCPAVKDRDGDGVADDKDACPDVAGVATADPKTNGCPAIKDKDGDGVADDVDACPDVAGVATADPKTNGCPSDRDHDGIPDSVDKCPDEPETVNGYQDEDGCPDAVPQAVQKFTGTIKGINFETGSAVITKGSYKVLDAAAAVLKQYPEIKMEIEGHTDDVGAHDANMKLSQDRADAVKKYLESKGTAADRLKATGYGPERPLDAAKTKAARAKNRRVEFRIQVK